MNVFFCGAHHLEEAAILSIESNIALSAVSRGGRAVVLAASCAHYAYAACCLCRNLTSASGDWSRSKSEVERDDGRRKPTTLI